MLGIVTWLHAFFYKQRFFSTQPQCCLTSQFRRIAHCWMLLVQVSKDILQPGQAFKMGIIEKIVNG